MSDGPSRIGQYPIERELGRGGMGIVYLARDPKLHRAVAIKVLPEAFAQDPERLARFEREARLLASLNHPNIAGIYGLEEADGQRFLVLEYVEGETLAERIARGRLPLDDALNVGRQIATALESAHDSGVIHRDLKPGNVKLTPGGEVKVLDFGLAKGAGTAESSPNMTQSPTIAYAPSVAGVILGTAAYMSPEQARGKPVDRRTDIWSFGCVLYECLTNRQLFSGETVSDTIARILEREPDWSALPPDTPDKVRELLKRCLDKDSKQRMRDIGDARIVLGDALAARVSPSRVVASAVTLVPPAVSRPRGAGAGVAWLVAATSLALAATVIMTNALRHAPEPHVTRFSIPGVPGSVINEDAAENALAPDGRTLAFCAADSAGTVQLWVRPLDALTPRPLSGTENASNPFWSADSRSLGFFADGKLKKVAAAGGEVEVLCGAKNGRGGTWSHDDLIVFSPDGVGPLFEVPGSGGDPQAATTLDSTRHETAHRYPSFLPDGRHFLFAALPSHEGKYDVWVGDVRSHEQRLLMKSFTAPVFLAPEYLIYQRGRNLVAQEFDPGGLRLIGQPISLPDVPAASQYNGYRSATASDAGDLAYLNQRAQKTQLTWLDRAGHSLGAIPLPTARYDFAVVSPDGKYVAATRSEAPSQADIWIVDLERSVETRFTFDPARADFSLWSPDGKQIAFQSTRDGPTNFFIKPANGARPETTLFASSVPIKNLSSWSADGKSICFEQLDPKTGWDLYVLPADGRGPPVPYARSAFNERWGAFSPDGRWIVYTSDESGQYEVYVQSYPEPGNKYRLSTSGATFPFWRADGREILFLSEDLQTMLSCDVVTTPSFHSTPPRVLFRLPPGAQPGTWTSDFKRLLVPLPVEDRTPATVTVVMNLGASLKKR